MTSFTYAAALPEIILAVGAMIVLLTGAFGTPGDENASRTGWLSIIVIAIAGFTLVTGATGPQRIFNDAFISDGFSRFVKLFILAGSAAAILLSLEQFAKEKLGKFEIPVLILLATTGMMMMVSAFDLIALYLGLELMSLALYVLAAVRRDDVRSSEAGMKYFVLGALSSGMLLYGASMLYGFTGSTNFAQIAKAAAAPGAAQNFGLIIGLVFLLVGLAFKVSAVPFHMWTPDVYEGSPTPVTAFFASGPKLAAMALLTRVLMGAFPGMLDQWRQILVFVALASMLLGAFAAIGQTNIKRLLAYSSIGHVGFALVGLAAGSSGGIQGVLVYLAIYVVMTLGSFACVLSMSRDGKAIEDISELSGLAETNLPMAFTFAMLLFSLAGVPPLAGFFAKWYVFSAAVQAGLYPLAIIGVLSSVVGAFYYLRIIKIMFFDDAKPAFEASSPWTHAIMIASGVFVLFYVVYPSPLVDAAALAASALKP